MVASGSGDVSGLAAGAGTAAAAGALPGAGGGALGVKARGGTAMRRTGVMRPQASGRHDHQHATLTALQQRLQVVVKATALLNPAARAVAWEGLSMPLVIELQMRTCVRHRAAACWVLDRHRVGQQWLVTSLLWLGACFLPFLIPHRGAEGSASKPALCESLSLHW